MSSYPDYIPDDYPDFIPEDSFPDYISPEGETDEERRKKLEHLARLRALEQPAPGLERSPLEVSPLERLRSLAAKLPTYTWPEIGQAAKRGIEEAGGLLPKTLINFPIDVLNKFGRVGASMYPKSWGVEPVPLFENEQRQIERTVEPTTPPSERAGLRTLVTAPIAGLPMVPLYGALQAAGVPSPWLFGGEAALRAFAENKNLKDIALRGALGAGLGKVMDVTPNIPTAAKSVLYGGTSAATTAAEQLSEFGKIVDPEAIASAATAMAVLPLLHGPRERPFNFTARPGVDPRVADFAEGVARQFHERGFEGNYLAEPDGTVKAIPRRGGAPIILDGRGVTGELNQETIDSFFRENKDLNPADPKNAPEAKAMTHVVDGRVVIEFANDLEASRAGAHEVWHAAEMLGIVTPEEHRAAVQRYAPDIVDDGTPGARRKINEAIAYGIEKERAGGTGVVGDLLYRVRQLGEKMNEAGYAMGVVSDRPLPSLKRIAHEVQSRRILNRPGELQPRAPAEAPEFIPEGPAKPPGEAPEAIPPEPGPPMPPAAATAPGAPPGLSAKRPWFHP